MMSDVSNSYLDQKVYELIVDQRMAHKDVCAQLGLTNYGFYQIAHRSGALDALKTLKNEEKDVISRLRAEGMGPKAIFEATGFKMSLIRNVISQVDAQKTLSHAYIDHDLSLNYYGARVLTKAYIDRVREETSVGDVLNINELRAYAHNQYDWDPDIAEDTVVEVGKFGFIAKHNGFVDWWKYAAMLFRCQYSGKTYGD